MSPTDQPINDDALRKKRIDLQRKVSLKFKEFQGFVTEFSENLSSGGMFIRTTAPQEPGSIFDFEFTLGEDQTLIHGLGEVVWIRQQDEGFDRPAGMGIRFLSLDPESRRLIDRVVAQRLEREASLEKGRIVPEEEWGMASEPPELPELGSGPHAGPEAREPGGLPFGADSGADSGVDSDLDSGVDPRADSGSGTGLGAGSVTPQRPAGPSPYARSYRVAAGSARASSSGSGRRALLIGLLMIVTLGALGALAWVIFPEVVLELVAGDGGERTAASRETPDAETPPESPEPRAPAEPAGEGPAAGAAPAAGGPAPGRTEPGPDPEAGPERASRPEPASEPEPAPAAEPDAGPAAGAARERPPAVEPEPSAPVPPAPEEDPFTRVQNITWEDRRDELLITIHLDGAVEEWDYAHARLEAPPRELIRIRGVRERFPRSTIPVAAGFVQRVRTGFHPKGRSTRDEDELHVVLDLEDPAVFLERSEAGNREIRLYLTREQ